MKPTFANFIVGPSNRLAHQTALTVAYKPDATYNPLLIRAASGLGKTHLLRAIGSHARQNKATRRIIHMTPGGLAHALHTALGNGRVDRLRGQYLNTEMLLVDDLQDIAGKNHTQKMLLNVLDELTGSDRQVVMASTTRPQDITSLDPRLCSRLSGSTVVDVQQPEAETYRRILRHKAAAHRVALSDEAAELVVAGADGSVRELENRLARLAAYASLHGRPIDATLVNEALAGKHATDERKISAIQQAVAAHFGVGTSEIKTRRRTRAVLVPRQIAMHLSHELTSVPASEIGRLFGGRSTAVVLHAFRRIQQLTRRDAGVAQAVRLLRDMLTHSGVDNSHISFPQDDLKQACG